VGVLEMPQTTTCHQPPLSSTGAGRRCGPIVALPPRLLWPCARSPAPWRLEACPGPTKTMLDSPGFIVHSPLSASRVCPRCVLRAHSRILPAPWVTIAATNVRCIRAAAAWPHVAMSPHVHVLLVVVPDVSIRGASHEQRPHKVTDANDAAKLPLAIDDGQVAHVVVEEDVDDL